ncbi:MAG: DUF4166 domain-containing protein [Pseudomonadota bacterium]
MKILILGGYGTFGGRLVSLLADEPSLTLMVGGRSLPKAVALCNKIRGPAQKQAVIFDRSENVEQQLQHLMPDVVVDASGPFQDYGDDPYRVIKACLALKLHYLDLADSSKFVEGVSQFDAAARDNNIVVLSGVSSFPVLTVAVCRQLALELTEVTRISAGIAPSAFAGVGLNVIRAITSYAGKPLQLVRHGVVTKTYALTETRHYVIAPPGKVPLNPTLFSLVDVPDLHVVPQQWPRLDAIWIGAGPVPRIWHYALIGLSWLVRIRLLPTLAPLAPLCHQVINKFSWGEHRGGMFVAVQGLDASGEYRENSWHMLAEGDDGPLIPSMAAAAVIRRMLNDQSPAPGARTAINDIELADYETQFARRRIVTGRRSDTGLQSDAPLYQRLLGDAWHKLPVQIREMHTLNGSKIVSGLADIERGTGFLAQRVANLFGFPAAGKEVPLSVNFSERRGQEHWLRYFGRRKMKSIQYEGKGNSRWLLNERFGLVTFGIALVVEGNKLKLVIRRWSVLGLPLPLILAPRTRTFEYVANDCFNFDVEVSHPLLGLIVHYKGFLKEQA